MPSDFDSGDDGRRRPPSRPPEDAGRGAASEPDIDPGLRPPKRPAGQRFGAPPRDDDDQDAHYPEEHPFTAAASSGGRPPPPPEGARYVDPRFENPAPLDESRRPPRREAEAEGGFYAPPPYDYDDYQAPPPEDLPRPRSRTLPVVIALLALAGFAALLWYAYTWGVGGLQNENLPVVTAVQEPPKVAPVEPGGMEIPNQDKQVLNQQNGNSQGPERLLPPPEEPNPPVMSTNPPPAPTPAPSPDTSQGGVADSGQPAAAPQAPPAPQAPQVEAPAPAPAAPAAPAPESAPAAAPAPPQQLTEAPPGSFVMQLASVRSVEAARAEWARMQQEHELLLGDMPLFIQQVELEGRGTYHRIQTGPFPSRSTAQDLCAQLKAAGQDCLVTQR